MPRAVLPVIDEVLLDGALFKNLSVSRSLMADQAARARRFHLDEAASAYLGRFIRDCSDLIIENRQFAIAPCEPTYIELDIQAMIDATGMPQTAELKGGYFATERDSTLGILISGSEVLEVVRSSTGRTTVALLSVDRGAPRGEEPRFSANTERNDWLTLALLLGTSVHSMPDEETRRDILDNHRIRFCVKREHADELQKQGAWEVLSGGAGFLRNAWAVLLLLNQKRGVTLTGAPHRSGIVKGHRRKFWAHSTVRIDLCGPDEMRRRALPSGREGPRRHEVRGHFVHHGLVKGCEHVWPSAPTEVIERDGREIPRWRCSGCGGLRSWRAQMMRGDSGKGYVVHKYGVTASG